MGLSPVFFATSPMVAKSISGASEGLWQGPVGFGPRVILRFLALDSGSGLPAPSEPAWHVGLTFEFDLTVTLPGKPMVATEPCHVDSDASFSQF